MHIFYYLYLSLNVFSFYTALYLAFKLSKTLKHLISISYASLTFKLDFFWSLLEDNIWCVFGQIHMEL